VTKFWNFWKIFWKILHFCENFWQILHFCENFTFLEKFGKFSKIWQILEKLEKFGKIWKKFFKKILPFLKCSVLHFFNDFLPFPRNFSLAQITRSKIKVLTFDFEMTSSWLNWWFEYGKILKILILENFGKITQTLFKKPRRQTRCPDVKQDAQMLNKMPRCPDVKQDAQANKMPRCPMRCPGKQDAQMPRQTKCPDAQANEMPRSPVSYPYVTRDAQGQISLGLGILASGL